MNPPKAPASSYPLGASDLASTIRVVVTATNGTGSASASSEATTVISPTPPTNATPPAISGEPAAGQTLQASTGTWSGAQPLAYAYQWERCGPGGEECEQISGATQSTYLLSGQDSGTTLRMTVTATNSAGSTPSTSSATTPVSAVAPSSTAAPAISGTAQDGATLTASDGAWSGSEPISYAYRWQRCDGGGGECTVIPGATSSSFTVADADVASTIRLSVTASNAAGEATTTSAATAPVPTTPPSNTTAPAVSGTLEQGRTLTATPGTWAGAPAPTFSYQWQRCDSSGEGCTDLTGAETASYTLGETDVGRRLRVRVAATNRLTATSAYSPASGVVAGNGASTPVNSEAPVISGPAETGQTLTVSNGSWSGTGPLTYAYQWQSCTAASGECEAIAGATAQSYTLTVGERGTTLRVLVTASGPGGSSGATSAPTSARQDGAPSELRAPSVSGIAVVGP